MKEKETKEQNVYDPKEAKDHRPRLTSWLKANPQKQQSSSFKLLLRVILLHPSATQFNRNHSNFKKEKKKKKTAPFPNTGTPQLK